MPDLLLQRRLVSIRKKGGKTQLGEGKLASFEIYTTTVSSLRDFAEVLRILGLHLYDLQGFVNASCPGRCKELKCIGYLAQAEET